MLFTQSPLRLLAVLLPVSLVRAAPFSGPAELTETSGEEVPEGLPCVGFTDWQSWTEMLLAQVTALLKQQCLDNFKDYKTENETLSACKKHFDDQIVLSQIDGCLPSKFNKEKCLASLSTGLREYGVYLEQVRHLYPERTEDLQWNTQCLANDILRRTRSSRGVEELGGLQLRIGLRSDEGGRAWETQKAAHIVFRELARFLQQAFRAVRFLNCRRQQC
ncbi:interleukin-6 [Lepisosteus oculatus]|uniref:interleukin-6 n=1 Tax=Lepisosteus oculatus TaxID=7918 RepID=UPI0035F50461